MKAKQLPRDQWDFASIPDEQMWICHDWEFSRTKLLMSKPCFVNDPKHWEDDSFFSFTAPDGHFGPPWPHASFASLDSTVRADIGSRLNRHQGLYPFSIDQLRNSDFPVASSETHVDFRGPSGASCHVGVFQIDWRFSKKAIRDSFEAWLAENEPEGIEKIERRSRKAPLSQEKANLKALGIFRIIQHHQMSVSSITSVYGSDLAKDFSSEAAWSKAKKRAEKVLKSFF